MGPRWLVNEVDRLASPETESIYFLFTLEYVLFRLTEEEKKG
jgi:hypothetical protein